MQGFGGGEAGNGCNQAITPITIEKTILIVGN